MSDSAPSRRQRIEQMLADDPADAFLRYSLALELRKEGSLEESISLLRKLGQEDPPYIPAFLMAAQQLVELDQISDAREVLRTGIEAARQQGEEHAAGEMGELLASLGSLG